LSNKERIVIIGATSAMAEHCARLWVQSKSVDLTLVGRDAGRVERVAADLRIRSPQSEIRVVQSDFIDANTICRTVDGIAAQGDVDLVLIAHGSMPAQSDCQDNLEVCLDALVVNGVSPVLFAEAFAKHMSKANRGTLALISSVAGDRGRKSNYVYGSAKGMVTRYAQGLQHRFACTGVKVVLIKPGPTDTPMTEHLKSQGTKLTSAYDVARLIVSAIEVNKLIVYAPKKWAAIMLIIKHLPSFVFNKLNI
jgi:decaprenylphospho-beta-D-erythro-pentofuranosid-2-ulose 2-reductase